MASHLILPKGAAASIGAEGAGCWLTWGGRRTFFLIAQFSQREEVIGKEEGVPEAWFWRGQSQGARAVPI